jgi:hypothetical protein
MMVIGLTAKDMAGVYKIIQTAARMKVIGIRTICMGRVYIGLVTAQSRWVILETINSMVSVGMLRKMINTFIMVNGSTVLNMAKVTSIKTIILPAANGKTGNYIKKIS